MLKNSLGWDSMHAHISYYKLGIPNVPYTANVTIPPFYYNTLWSIEGFSYTKDILEMFIMGSSTGNFFQI